MNSVINLNTTWAIENFLNYIEHSFPSSIVDCYDSLDKEGKNTLKMIETPTNMFKTLCKEFKTKFIVAKLDSEEKVG